MNVSSHFSSCSEVFSSLLEIEGYARFNALYDFWESIICLLFVFVFVLLFRPGLLAFALFNCCLSVTSVIYYVYLTYEKRGMFDEYMEGMISPLDIKVSFL
jgi:O-antigen/teichoic acid export membrane protein